MVAQEQQMAQAQEAARKRRECQHPSHALESQSQLEAEGQNGDTEDEDELLI